tara:strand:- start:68 stop:325 length:258 start_codon:yes stop_codon:yes gene_type:complete
MKAYISSGNFRKVFNTDLNKKEIVIKMFLDHLTGKEWLDEHVYVDERSCKDYISADKETTVWETEDILEECYHILKGSNDKDFEE